MDEDKVRKQSMCSEKVVYEYTIQLLPTFGNND